MKGHCSIRGSGVLKATQCEPKVNRVERHLDVEQGQIGKSLISQKGIPFYGASIMQ